MKEKRLKKIIIGLLSISVIGVAGGLYIYGNAVSAEPAVNSVSDALINQKNTVKRDSNLTVEQDKYQTTAGKALKVNAKANSSITYEVKDKEMATVDEQGNVKCKKLGKTALIIKTVGNGTYNSGEVEVPLVIDGKKQQISGLDGDYHIYREEKLDIEPKATTEIKCVSKNPDIADVNDKGEIIGKKGGTAEIQVMAVSDGVYNETSETIKVEVEKYSLEERTDMAIDATVDWAIGIAKDNTFHYGKPSWAHHNGCYFCGTNQAKGSAKRKAGGSLNEVRKTYCCNPFVTAAFVHGGGVTELSCVTKGMRVGLANDKEQGLDRTDKFIKVKKPSSISGLKKGDVVISPTHAALYAGDGMIVEAAHHDNGKKDSYWNSSIRYGKYSTGAYKRVTKVYRYIGYGKF